jgi:hypothetical protein
MATNREHRSIPLDATERLILRACNGERDAAGIVTFLATLPREALLHSEPESPTEGETGTRASWQRHVALGLPKLAAAGFF